MIRPKIFAGNTKGILGNTRNYKTTRFPRFKLPFYENMPEEREKEELMQPPMEGVKRNYEASMRQCFFLIFVYKI